MFVPLITPWLKSEQHKLERRKGGGGRSGGSDDGSVSGDDGGVSGDDGGISGDDGGVSSAEGGDSGAEGGPSSASITTASGESGDVRSYGSGSTEITTIPAGQPFSGRTSGGGMRSDVFGTRQYGSGYPGTNTPGITGRNFPFGFWPVIFGAATRSGAANRFHSNEYGEPNNSSRPGGPLFDAGFQPPDGSNTYRVLADNTTVQTLIFYIGANCSINTTSITAVPYNTSDPTQPKPEQVIQYYRSSSIALTLDGYNDSAVFSSDINASDTPLPSNLNSTFLDCLNQTIGAAAPLIDAGIPRAQMSTFLGLALVVLHFLRWAAL